jgi:predicted small metal-binding protein
MAKLINCDCGYVIRGETDELLLEDAHKHMREMHPEMVGKITDQDLLAMAELVA